MTSASARQEELIELAYAYVQEHGLAGMSLRPLARAIGSSPRVLLFLFGSKDGLVRALLDRARTDELAHLERLQGPAGAGLAQGVSETWVWLAAPEHRGVLRLWLESYAQSLVAPDGPSAGFARSTVDDWLGYLEQAQTPAERARPDAGLARAAALTVLRGALLDLLATGDEPRCRAVVEQLTRGAGCASPTGGL